MCIKAVPKNLIQNKNTNGQMLKNVINRVQYISTFLNYIIVYSSDAQPFFFGEPPNINVRIILNKYIVPILFNI